MMFAVVQTREYLQ